MNFYKALDNRSISFKINEKKELTHKVISKEWREKHQLQISGKINPNDLIKFYTTFKPSDYPFEPPEIEDEPISLKSSFAINYPKKLPTYRFQISDYNAFYTSLKIIISVLKFQSTSDKSLEFIVDLLKYFFKIDCINQDDVSCYDFSDSDRDILISIIAPHILNKSHSEDEEQESSHSQGNSQSSNGKDKDQTPQESFRDCLSFADIENQSFLELIDTKYFTSEPNSLQNENDESYMNTDTPDPRTQEEIYENEEFIPHFKQEYSVLFGGSNYYVFIRWLYTMYERLRLAHKIIWDQVNHDYNEKKDEILHSYKIYLKSKERCSEEAKSNKENGNETHHFDLNQINNLEELNEEEVKRSVVNHKLSILIGISVTRYKCKIDSSTFEDLVRTFLGIKSFFFFTFDKLIHTTIKSFHALNNDEFLKSKAFKLFRKYSNLKDRQREKLYLEDYKIKLSDMSITGGFTTRLLFSPKSNILWINFFNISMPYTNSALVEDLSEYRTNFTLIPPSEKMHSDDLPIPSSSVFLKRNKKLVMKSLENNVAMFNNMTILNNMPNSFSTSWLRVRYHTQQTDIVHRIKKRNAKWL